MSHFKSPFFVDGVPVMGGNSVITTKGNSYWIDPEQGSDSYDGKSAQYPFATLATAYAALTNFNNDVLYLIANGDSVNHPGGMALNIPAAFTWDKSFTHFIGVSPPLGVGQRARMTPGAVFTPMFSITGSGCRFHNLQWFQNGNHATNAAVCLSVSGQRNYFANCMIAGGGIAASAGNAAMRSLLLTGAQECLFVNCEIGLDTIARGNVAASEIECNTAATRNIFRQCNIATYGGGANTFLLVGAAGLDRYILFDNCTFVNMIGSAATTLAVAFTINAAPGGLVLLKHCEVIGVTNLCSPNSSYLYGTGAQAAATGERFIGLTG